MSVLQVLTSGFLFCMIRYQVIKTVPFNMLEMLMAHHAPFNPNAVEDRIRDMGILSAFKVIPTTEGGDGFPKTIKSTRRRCLNTLRQLGKPYYLKIDYP